MAHDRAWSIGGLLFGDVFYFIVGMLLLVLATVKLIEIVWEAIRSAMEAKTTWDKVRGVALTVLFFLIISYVLYRAVRDACF